MAVGIKDKVAILGVGCSRFGERWDASPEDLMVEAYTEAMAKFQEVTGLDAIAGARLLWDTYHPQFYVWIPFALIGVVAAVALWVFGRMARKWQDMNA